MRSPRLSFRADFGGDSGDFYLLWMLSKSGFLIGCEGRKEGKGDRISPGRETGLMDARVLRNRVFYEKTRHSIHIW